MSRPKGSKNKPKDNAPKQPPAYPSGGCACGGKVLIEDGEKAFCARCKEAYRVV